VFGVELKQARCGIDRASFVACDQAGQRKGAGEQV